MVVTTVITMPLMLCVPLMVIVNFAVDLERFGKASIDPNPIDAGMRWRERQRRLAIAVRYNVQMVIVFQAFINDQDVNPTLMAFGEV